MPSRGFINPAGSGASGHGAVVGRVMLGSRLDTARQSATAR